MNADNENKPFLAEDLDFQAFHLLRGEVNGDFSFDINKVKHYHFEVDHSVELNEDQTGAKSNLSVTIITSSDNAHEATGRFDFAFLFGIEKITHFVTPVGPNLFSLDYPLANSIASISYSTARGVLLTRLQGTSLRAFILPVMDPNKLLKTEPQNLKLVD